MKTILIIFTWGWMGESISVTSVEFNNTNSCESAKSVLIQQKKNNPKKLKYIAGHYICVKK